MSSLGSAIEIPDSSDDDSDDEPLDAMRAAARERLDAEQPPPVPSRPTTAPPAAAPLAPVGENHPCRVCLFLLQTGARKVTCDACLAKVDAARCKAARAPPTKKLRSLEGSVVAATSAQSPPPVIPTWTHCTVLKCTDGSCSHLHQCDGDVKGRGCKGLWLASRAFGLKKGGLKRNRRCKECADPIQNAKTSEKRRQKAITYELETQGDNYDLSDAALRARCDAAINYTTELIADYWVTYPDGFAFAVYGASMGSKGFTVEEEGVKQFTNRGFTPPIIDASGRAPDVALNRAWGPGGVSVYNCGSSKVISHAVEKALHEHFTPICDASDGKMPRTWRKLGAGAPQGIGPYHVCIRIMPLPLPHGWRRSF